MYRHNYKGANSALVCRKNSGSVRETKKDMWDGGNAMHLNFEVKLTKGVHVLEVYGAELCCDGLTTWKFKRNNTAWLLFNVYNLNKACNCGLVKKIQ